LRLHDCGCLLGALSCLQEDMHHIGEENYMTHKEHHIDTCTGMEEGTDNPKDEKEVVGE
jgi:hypothetical protein